MDLSEDDLSKTDSSSTIDPSDTTDDVATFTGSYNIAISYSGTTASIVITDTLGNTLTSIDSLEITTSGAGVTINNLGHSTIHYTLSGSSTAGFFKLYSPSRQVIELSDLTLTGMGGAAINNQSDKRTYIVLTGSLTASSTGAGIYDTEEKDIDAASSLKCDGDFIMGGGSLTASATGAGGKGISIGGKASFNGGSVTATASGSNRFYVSSKYSDMTSNYERYKTYPHSFAKAIKCDGAIVVQGEAYVYGKSAAHEGITCDGTWTQDGGTVIAEAYDDAVNSAGVVTVSDGYLRGTSSNNDGIDANAAINISGGVVIGEGASQPECGIDSVEGTSVTVNGGYVISRGGSINSFVTTSSKAFVQTTTSANAKVGLVSGSTQILAYQAPSSGGTQTLFCTPEMTANSSYTLYTGVSSITEQNADFTRFGTSFTGGSSGSSLTASSSAGSSGPGGGGSGGGGWPGGGGRP